MAQQHINTGTVDNDGTGDTLKAAMVKTEANFTDLYGSVSGKASLASPAFTGTPTAPTATAGTATTQIATTAFVAALVTGLLRFKNSMDCSANPNYPAALKGDAYVVSVAGKIGGASGMAVDVGDVFVASADNAGGTQAAVGTSWFILEHNLAGALLAANNLSDLASAATARSNLGLVIGTNVQAFSAALALYAAISPSANVQSMLGAANYAAIRTLLGLVIGTNVEAVGVARSLIHPGYVAARWYWPPRAVLGAGTALVANTIRLNPIILAQAITVSDLAAKIVTVSAGGNFQIAIYASDPTTKMPTGSALAVTGNISTATAAVISADITGADVALPTGLYWLAVNADNSVVVLNGQGTTALATSFIGTATLANLSGAVNAAPNPLTIAQTFGTWPSLTSASFTEAPGTAETAVAFKVSSVP